MNNQTKGYMAATSYAFIIGFSFLFVKYTLQRATPIDILAHRFTVSFVAATLVAIFFKIKITMDLKSLLKLLPLALFYPTLFFGFQVYGLARTTATESGIIQATIPIFTLLLASLFLKEKTNRWQRLSIYLSVLGVIYIFVMKGNGIHLSNNIGPLLILLSCISSSFYSVLARKMTQQYPLFIMTYVITAIGFFIFNGLAVFQHITSGTLSSYFEPFTHFDFLISILFLGILSSLCTSFLSNYALSKIDASKVSVFGNLSTLITMLTGSVFLNEILTYYHVIGAILVILGVIGTNYFSKLNKRTT